MIYKPFQQRVVDEQLELETKLNALERFQDSAIHDDLDNVDKNLLQEQKMSMIDYNDVLKLRIARFN